MNPSDDDRPRPMKPGEARRLGAHSRGLHRERADDLCPLCRDPEYWTKKARRLIRLLDGRPSESRGGPRA